MHPKRGADDAYSVTIYFARFLIFVIKIFLVDLPLHYALHNTRGQSGPKRSIRARPWGALGWTWRLGWVLCAGRDDVGGTKELVLSPNVARPTARHVHKLGLEFSSTRADFGCAKLGVQASLGLGATLSSWAVDSISDGRPRIIKNPSRHL